MDLAWCWKVLRYMSSVHNSGIHRRRRQPGPFAVVVTQISGIRDPSARSAIALSCPPLSIIAAIRAGGYHRVDFFHLTESGVSVTEPNAAAVIGKNSRCDNFHKG